MSVGNMDGWLPEQEGGDEERLLQEEKMQFGFTWLSREKVLKDGTRG